MLSSLILLFQAFVIKLLKIFDIFPNTLQRFQSHTDEATSHL